MTEMRVLHLRRSEGFYGAERVILAIAHGTRNRGVVSWIGCINDSRNPCPALHEEAVRQGLPAVLLPCSMRFDPFCLLDIIGRARSLKIDIIHCHGFKADFYGFLAGRRLGLPAISTQHGWTHSNRLIRVWERIDLILLRRFSRVAAVSEAIGSELVKRGIFPGIVCTVTNGISLPEPGHRSDAFRKSLSASRKNPLIGIVGRLSVEKGHRDFFMAVKRVLQVRPDIRFWVVGTGTLREDLEAYARDLGIADSLRFLGFRADMEAVYGHLDIVVSASLREGIPVALLEAMAMARPVIATRVGGIPSIIDDGVNGILVPPRTPEMLADRMLELLANPGKRGLLGRHARKTVSERFSANRMSDDYFRIYQDVMAGR
jgi:glycosyltransferase involved in cell wall biosynthesis